MIIVNVKTVINANQKHKMMEAKQNQYLRIERFMTGGLRKVNMNLARILSTFLRPVVKSALNRINKKRKF
jgi:hypothetical protein